MRWASVLSLLAFSVASLQPADAATAKTVHHKASSSSSSHTTSHSKSSAKKPSSAHSTRRSRYSHRRRVARGPSYQLHPDPERYQQIQKALADRGYFKGNVNGIWGTDSVDALKHFQADHKLDDSGKIDALSLIGLGLGPKHDGTTAALSHPANAAGTELAEPPPVPTVLPQNSSEPPPDSSSNSPSNTSTQN